MRLILRLQLRRTEAFVVAARQELLCEETADEPVDIAGNPADIAEDPDDTAASEDSLEPNMNKGPNFWNVLHSFRRIQSR